MTLKERILPLVADGSYAELTVRSIEQIADEFAIGFAKWCFNVVSNGKHKGVDTAIELLEIYKKEKGL
jgi:hypothetical protein